MSEEMIVSINEVITTYLKDNPEVKWVPVKKLMPEFIAVGIFRKDEKKGLPIRKVLNALDKAKRLAEPVRGGGCRPARHRARGRRRNGHRHRHGHDNLR